MVRMTRSSVRGIRSPALKDLNSTAFNVSAGAVRAGAAAGAAARRHDPVSQFEIPGAIPDAPAPAAAAGGDFRSLPWYAPGVSSAMLLLQAGATGALTEPAPRVVVFFVADDLGWNDIGYNSNDMKGMTPNMDQ